MNVNQANQVREAYNTSTCDQEVVLELEVTNTGQAPNDFLNLTFAGIRNDNKVAEGGQVIDAQASVMFANVIVTVDVCAPDGTAEATDTVTANAEGLGLQGSFCTDSDTLEITLPSIPPVGPTPAPSVSLMPTESALPTLPSGFPLNKAEPCVVRDYVFNEDTTGLIQGELARSNGVTSCEDNFRLPGVTQRAGPFESYMIIGNFEPINPDADITACITISLDFSKCSNNAFQVIIYQPVFNPVDIQENYVSYSGGTEQKKATFSGAIQENLPYQIVLVQTTAVASGFETCRFSLGAFDETCPSEAPSSSPVEIPS